MWPSHVWNEDFPSNECSLVNALHKPSCTASSASSFSIAQYSESDPMEHGRVRGKNLFLRRDDPQQSLAVLRSAKTRTHPPKPRLH